MLNNTLVPHIMAIIALFFIASVSAIILRKIKVPYTIGLVVIGVVIAYILKDVKCLDIISDIRLSHDVILYILLPTLIFDAATNIDSKLLFKNIAPIMNLAIPGLILSTAIVGVLVNYLTPLQAGTAFLFGALISATDPVAVVALFKDMGAPERLAILVDGESLFNDATAIVLFNIIVACVVSQTSMSMHNIMHGVLEFCIVFFGGIAVGVLIGFFIISFMKYAKNDPLIHIALSTVLAYVAFIVAEYYLEVSGVMSVLAAGIVLSWYGTKKINKKNRRQLKHFWEYASFVCNSFIFLLLGVAELNLIVMIGHSRSIMLYILTAIVSVTIARLIVVYFIPQLFPSKCEKIDNFYKTIIFWGGLRGAVPLALVLSLSHNFEDQQLLVELTLGVVLFTLLVQGTTMKPLMRLLKIKS